jgi:hypothetical protein
MNNLNAVKEEAYNPPHGPLASTLSKAPASTPPKITLSNPETTPNPSDETKMKSLLTPLGFKRRSSFVPDSPFPEHIARLRKLVRLSKELKTAGEKRQ